MHINGLRFQLVLRCMEATQEMAFHCAKDKPCEVHFYIVNLYVNVRLHFMVKTMNRGWEEKNKVKPAQRKTATFQHQ